MIVSELDFHLLTHHPYRSLLLYATDSGMPNDMVAVGCFRVVWVTWVNCSKHFPSHVGHTLAAILLSLCYLRCCPTVLLGCYQRLVSL